MLGPVVEVTGSYTGTQTVVNETVTADYDDPVDLRGYDIVSGSETVWGYNGTDYVEATSPDDYSIDEGPGELTFNESSTLIDDGEDVKVTYDYQATDELTALVLGFLPVMLGVLIFVPIAMRVGGMV